jgi:uncharacterized protein YfeS
MVPKRLSEEVKQNIKQSNDSKLEEQKRLEQLAIKSSNSFSFVGDAQSQYSASKPKAESIVSEKQ